MNKYEEAILQLCEEGTTLGSTYTNAKTSIKLVCHKGHVRNIIPSNLISRHNGIICRECDGLSLPGKKTTDIFREELKVLYPTITLESEYTGAHNKVTLKCECGNTWEAIPTNLLNRESDATCSVCNPRTAANKLNIEEVNDRLHVHYPYLTVTEYRTSSKHSTLLDSRCGKYSEALTGNLIRGLPYKCPHCEPHLIATSAMEQNIIRFIKENYDGWLIESDKVMINPKHLDIVLPDLGVAIEFNGGYYHGEDKVDSNYHLNKTKGVEEYDYKLIHITEEEWIHKRKIVESRLLNILGRSLKIWARKTSVKEIPFPKDFLETNHIQGSGPPTSINYGLFIKEELIAVMTFNKPRFIKSIDKEIVVDYELVRYCCKLKHTVVGGASKLLSTFRKNYPNKTIMSYSDKRWSIGSLYLTLGFMLDHTSLPGYRWYKGTHSLSRYDCQKSKLSLLLPKVYKEGMTEVEAMHLAGYYRVYDCGQDIWILK